MRYVPENHFIDAVEHADYHPEDIDMLTHSLDKGIVPYIEIPDEHGDLIERSLILDKVKDKWSKICEEKGYDVMSDFWLALCKVIEEAPTILEASK